MVGIRVPYVRQLEEHVECAGNNTGRSGICGQYLKEPDKWTDVERLASHFVLRVALQCGSRFRVATGTLMLSPLIIAKQATSLHG